MKGFIIAISLISYIQTSPAIAGELDGMKFCRSVQTDGSFGQPKRIRKHCLSFADDVATDNASTFFGNPPRRFSYTLKKNQIINTDTKKKTGYSVQEDGNITAIETGLVLTLEE
jgi:hypothetical protein